MFQLYATIVKNHYKILILVNILFIALLSIGLSKLSVSNDFRVYFSDDNPQLVAFEKLEATFNKQDNLAFLVSAKKGTLYNQTGLKLIQELTEHSWRIPYSQRVSSITNYQHTKAINDDLITEFLIEQVESLNTEQINDIQNIILNDPTLINNIINKAGTVTSIVTILNLPAENQVASQESVDNARLIVQKLQPLYPNFEIKIAGSAYSNVSMGDAVKQDISTLSSTSFLLIIIGIYFFLRSWSAILIISCIIGFSVIGTFGLFGHFNFILTPVAGFVPTIIMTIAVADCIHILVSYHHSLRNGKNKNQAIIESLRINASPVFITSITTIIGVLCLNFSDSPPYQDLGNMVATGVLLAYIFSMLLLPSALLLLPTPKNCIEKQNFQYMDRFAQWVIKHYKMLLIIMVTSVIVITSFITKNQLSERWHEYFDTSYEIRQSIELINDELSGVHRIHYQIHSGIDEGVYSPDFLQDLTSFVEWFRQQEGVAYVESFTDTIKLLNQKLHNDDPSWYQIPSSNEMAAQIVLMHELSLPLGFDLDNRISLNHESVRISVVLKKTHSEQLLLVDQQALQWAETNTPNLSIQEGTGLDIIFANIMHRNIHSLLKGTALALVIISFILIFALRSLKIGLLSLVPNLAPAAVAYGLWGIFVGQIDLSISIVACMSLGIVVDDTVHFLSKYRRAKHENKLSTEEGIRYAFNTVGVALTTTTVALVAGFLVMTLSHFNPTFSTGILLAITLSIALVVDFLLLPPLLLTFDRTNKQS